MFALLSINARVRRTIHVIYAVEFTRNKYARLSIRANTGRNFDLFHMCTRRLSIGRNFNLFDSSIVLRFLDPSSLPILMTVKQIKPRCKVQFALIEMDMKQWIAFCARERKESGR